MPFVVEAADRPRPDLDGVSWVPPVVLHHRCLRVAPTLLRPDRCPGVRSALACGHVSAPIPGRGNPRGSNRAPLRRGPTPRVVAVPNWTCSTVRANTKGHRPSRHQVQRIRRLGSPKWQPYRQRRCGSGSRSRRRAAPTTPRTRRCAQRSRRWWRSSPSPSRPTPVGAQLLRRQRATASRAGPQPA